VSDRVPIYVKKDLYEKLERMAREGGFKDVNEFVEFILQEVVETPNVEMSKEDEEKVKERLRALGYL